MAITKCGACGAEALHVDAHHREDGDELYGCCSAGACCFAHNKGWAVEPLSGSPDPRRERIATAVLAGMCANSFSDGYHKPISLNTSDEMARDAVALADALIAELDKPTK